MHFTSFVFHHVVHVVTVFRWGGKINQLAKPLQYTFANKKLCYGRGTARHACQYRKAFPPSSHLLRGHILNAFYATHIQIRCLDGQLILCCMVLRSLMDYYFHRRTAESVLMIALIAVHALRVLVSCTCRKSLIPCCSFCKCHSVETALQDGRNPCSE